MISSYFFFGSFSNQFAFDAIAMMVRNSFVCPMEIVSIHFIDTIVKANS